MMEVVANHLFKLRDGLDRDEFVAAYAGCGLRAGIVYWLVGSRPSSLGGYIGTFRDTYRHGDNTSPGPKEFANVPMRYVKPAC